VKIEKPSIFRSIRHSFLLRDKNCENSPLPLNKGVTMEKVKKQMQKKTEEKAK
jgi:hypothetical protein